jgi:radical SAM superfamily enzyme YgiQ (UPF0313 family)
MSSLGYQWMLHILNQAGFSAERAFLPDDLGSRPRGPLLSYETRTPVGNYPVVGISLAYELELVGLVQALELAGIPALREERGPHHPRIIIGGPLSFSNPLPAAPFADAMLVGEADDTVVPAFKAASTEDRDQFLSVIRSLPGGFVPEIDGSVLPSPAQADDTGLPAQGPILAPEAELRDMFLIEGERGCHRRCSFCVMRRGVQSGMRLYSPDRILSLIPDEARRVGLVGAAISDHPKLTEILTRLIDSGREVGVSSLRADRVARKPEIARLLRAGGYKTLTVASDAASQALRRQIAKGTTEAHLLACAEQAALHRYRVLKIYMMVGVPGETDADIDELIRFTTELSRVHPIALGIAPFVPKRNTPMDADVFMGIKPVERRLKRLSRGLKGKADVRPTSARWAWVEAMLAQAGTEGGEATLQAIRSGGRFRDWKHALESMDPQSMAPWRSTRIEA